MIGSKLTRFAGSQVARQAMQKHSGSGGALDLKFGLHLLFRDRNVPLLYKLFAFGLGGALTWLLVALETPLEMILATFLPVIGFTADMMIDGAEIIVCPILFAALILPHVAPRTLVDIARGMLPAPATAHRS